MVVPWICVSISKSQVICRKAKKTRFWHFLVILRKKISKNFDSANIDVWRLAHSSFRSLCSKFFKTPVEVSDIFKNMGHSPVRSWMIQNRDTQKSCFLTTFLEKIIVLTHFDPINTPKCYTWLESYGSPLSDGTKIFFHPVNLRFLVMSPDRLLHSSWQCVIGYLFIYLKKGLG